jgi:hypothetical protein
MRVLDLAEPSATGPQGLDLGPDIHGIRPYDEADATTDDQLDFKIAPGAGRTASSVAGR